MLLCLKLFLNLKLISSLNTYLIIPLFLQPDFFIVIKILISQENSQVNSKVKFTFEFQITYP